MLEIPNLHAFDQWHQQGAEREVAAILDVDLRSRSDALANGHFPGCLFLGCDIEHRVMGHLVHCGAVVLTDRENVDFSIHRGQLYSIEELYEGFDPDDPDGYHSTWDASIFRQYTDHGGPHPDSIGVSLARRLHDHSITHALNQAIEDHRVVAVMGGHGMERAHPFYAKVARVSRTLARAGYLLVSGGGPGAMEATHLGAWFANFDDDHLLDDALQILSVRPPGTPTGREYADRDWLHRAWKVRERYPLPASVEIHSIGIPTWLYGHEPPAAFATQVAKYFANSVREEGLLAIAEHGVIYAPGSAGTTQEIFQDATQNHYGSYGSRSPMILMGREHWTEKRPVWPLLKQVAAGQIYAELLSLTDDEDEVVERILTFDLEPYRSV